MKTMTERCAAEGHRWEKSKETLSSVTERCKWCDKTRTYLKHCCGAQGFNPMLGDSCLACDSHENGQF